MSCDSRTQAFDQRGWGRSVKTPSQRGLTGSTVTVLNDLSSLVDSVLLTAASMSVPVFLMGHSMGGAEVLQWAARGPFDMRSQIRGYLAESPYLALHPSAQPSRFVATAGRLAAKVVPRRQMYVSSASMSPRFDESLPSRYSREPFLSRQVAQLNVFL